MDYALLGLRTDPAPQDGNQILAMAVEVGHQPGMPRWCIVQWASDYPGGQPYWRWSVPGRTARVEICGWLPLPINDWLGDAAKAFSVGEERDGG